MSRKLTSSPCACHRCFAARKDYLVPDAPAQAKTSKHMWLRVEAAAAGAHMKGARDNANKWIEKSDTDGRNVQSGPGKLSNSKNHNSHNNIAILAAPSLFENLPSSLSWDASRCKARRGSLKVGGAAGARFLFNTFWLIQHFCVNLMNILDPMHRIMVTFLKAILSKNR